MPRFNTIDTPEVMRNRAGAVAYKQDAKTELASLLLTSFVQDQFYRGAGEQIIRAAELIRQVDPIFAAKAAVFARQEFGMRSISHVAAGEIADIAKGEQWTKDFFNKIIRRPDDMTEILSYILGKQTAGKSTVPNAVKKGFATAFTRFDDYQLAKYRGEGKKINLVDAVRLVHPCAVRLVHTFAVHLVVTATYSISEPVGQGNGSARDRVPQLLGRGHKLSR